MTQQVVQPVIREVLGIVAEEGATYATEVKWKTSIDSIRQAGEILHKLEEAEVLERLVPGMKNNDERLMNRRRDMWADGVKGLGDFRDRKWYGLNSDLTWNLKVKGRNFYINEFHEKIPEEDLDPMGEVHGLTEYAAEAIN